MLGVTLLGAATFSALGLLLGTGIAPQQIGLMFSVIVAPMIFFGCTYYPWQGLRTPRDRIEGIPHDRVRTSSTS